MASSNTEDTAKLGELSLTLERDLFLRSLIRELAGTFQDVVGVREASGYISVVGARIGEQINHDYKAALAVDRLTREQVAAVLVDLKRRIQGDFRVIAEDADRIVLGNRACPFGDTVLGRPSMCMMTSNVFGHIAADNLGYARVELRETIAQGHPGCRVVVHLKPFRGTGRRAGILQAQNAGMNSQPFSVPADDFPEPMLLVSPDGEVLAINRAAREDFGAGYPTGRLSDLVTDPPEKVMAFVRLCSSTSNAVPGALRFRTSGGILDCRCDGHRTAEGLVYLRCRPKAGTTQAFAVLNEKIAELAREIAIRMRTEQRLEELLRSREILIQELHHRIRNSIQMAISLAGLQMREATDGATQEQFLKHSNRLKAIGLVYRTLYREQDFTRLDISTFVSDLCTELRRAYRGSEISFSIQVEATLLSLEQAVPFALIVNELVTNALVRASEAEKRGSIQVSLRHRPPGQLELTVADNGIGIPAELLRPASGGRGLDLVRMLARQLDASFEVDHVQGTTFRVAFQNAAAGAMSS